MSASPIHQKFALGAGCFFTEHTPDAVFSGGQIAQNPLIVLIANTLEGGLDSDSKKKLIADATAILREHAGANGNQLPVYVVIHEVPELDWGMYGQQVSLAALR